MLPSAAPVSRHPDAARRSPLRWFRNDLGSVVLFLMGPAGFQEEGQEEEDDGWDGGGFMLTGQKPPGAQV